MIAPDNSTTALLICAGNDIDPKQAKAYTEYANEALFGKVIVLHKQGENFDALPGLAFMEARRPTDKHLSVEKTPVYAYEVLEGTSAEPEILGELDFVGDLYSELDGFDEIHVLGLGKNSYAVSTAKTLGKWLPDVMFIEDWLS